MPEQIKKILDKIIDWWKKFNTKQRTLIISITAVVVVALIILAVIVSRPTMVDLITCESAADASEIKNLLSDNNISYEVDENLNFKVNSKDEVDAIMLLGTNNFPATSYDINNVTDGGFSTTSADKQKKYQVYLEKKFAEHISALDNIESASVDITLPENDGTILNKEKEGTAAVTLTLKRDIDEDQAYAIARFIATELGNESTAGVTIIDSKARVIFSGNDEESGVGVATSQLSYKEKQEKLIKDDIQAALRDSNVFSDIQIAMNLDIDFDKTETASKKYSYPDGLEQSLLDYSKLYNSSATNGQAAVPGTDSNGDDTSYVVQDGDNSSQEISSEEYDWLNNEEITKKTSNGGTILDETSSISVVATRYVVYKEDVLKEDGTLDDLSWEEFKAQHSDPVKVEDVDPDFVSLVANATGFSQDKISFIIYEQPEFVDTDTSGRSLSDIFQILLAVLIFALLGFVVFKSTRSAKQAEPEPELSVESLLESTAESTDPLEDIGYTEKSETRLLIEKFVDENPEAVALLLRNWLNEDWE